MSSVDEIKSRLDIVELIGQTVRLKKAGRIYKGLCPFHAEKTPSFIVYPDQGSWHCFGACGTGGDIITFVMKRDHLEFGEALRLLAARAGVELAPRSAGEENKRPLLDMHREAAAYYHYLLLNHPAAGFAREYLERRRINRTSIENFQLGFAPAAATGLVDHLQAKGFPIKELERAGLAIANETGGGVHDRFRGRLMFPIRDRRGQTIAFGARALEADQQPKYLNSPDSPLFNKSDTLYGLDLAREAIRAGNLAVIVEGYTDVIVAHQEGFKNVVAAMGTALTERQLGQLQRLTKRYALALDADVAGAAATERGLELARAALTRKQVAIPVGAGLVRFEEQLDAELLIIALPPGRDPDEVILSDPARWKQLVETATPLVDYYFQAQTRDLDLRTAHGKDEAVRRLLPVINEMRNNVQRAHYTQELARLVQVDVRTLVPDQGATARTRQKPLNVPTPTVAGSPRYEEQFLALLLAQPALFPRVRFLAEEDFLGEASRELWAKLSRQLEADGDLDLDELLDELGEETRGTVEEVRALSREFEYSEGEAARELEAAAYRLRLRRDREELIQLQYALAESPPEEGDALVDRADLLRRRIAEAQRALSARTVLRSGPPAV